MNSGIRRPGIRVKPAGLLVLRAHLGEHLGKRKAHGDRDPQLALDLALDVEGDRLVGGAQGPSQPREIGEGLVDGVLLHLGREAPDDVVHAPRKEAVGLVVRGQHDEPRADLFRLVQGNAPLDPQGLGGVARAGHDPPLAPRDEGLALELRVDRLLAGREEGIAVDVQNGLRPGAEIQH